MEEENQDEIWELYCLEYLLLFIFNPLFSPPNPFPNIFVPSLCAVLRCFHNALSFASCLQAAFFRREPI